MNVLCTGGAGFIGVNFLHAFVARFPQHRFINADALTYAASPKSLEPISGLPNYVFERADVADAERIDAIFEAHRPDAVVHFAAESHVDRSIRGPREFVRTNVEGTFVLLEACRRHWTGRSDVRFHHVGTDEVYGSIEAGAFTESSRYDPSSPYAASKAASDHLVRAWGRTYGLPFTITTSSNNYGPYQFPEKLVPLMILHALERQRLPIYGEGLNVRDWLFVEDHCEAIWRVLERGRPGETYVVGGRNEKRNIDVVDAICRAVASETGAPLEELSALVERVKDRPGHDLRYAIDPSKIERELGWRPRESFESGLRKTVRWYLAHPEWVREVRTGEYRAWMAEHYGAAP